MNSNVDLNDEELSQQQVEEIFGLALGIAEFVFQLDFKKIDEDTIEIVQNRFKFSDLSKEMKLYLNAYFNHLETIN